MRHVPVLLEEVVDSLQLKSNQHVIDGTLGDGGHAERLLEATAPNGKLLGFDADSESLLRAKKYLYGFGGRVVYARENFDQMKTVAEREHFGPVQAVLLDLGWSSPQFEERGRGFSFQKDEPLDMRYAVESGRQKAEGKNEKAADLVNHLGQQELERIFREYAEEDLSAEIAKEIVDKRREKPIEKTKQLVDCVLAAYRKKLKTDKEVPWVGGLHPATKVFQALRIAVNDELGALERVLPQAVDILAPGGRLAVVTFHSLEDRVVKHFFKDMDNISITFIHKKPVVAGKKEWEENPRARSAKLRVVQKI